MGPEPYRPRENDHLVEPMFAGLGMTEEHETQVPLRGRRRFLRLALVVLGLFVLLSLALLALG